MRNIKLSNRRLVWALSTALPLLVSLGVANAQDASPATDSSTVVIVTGQRASAQKAVRIKRNADQILDTVSASEIGQLPDFNAGDALKRVTGVNTLLYQGEPRFIIARGLSQNYNDVLIDGFSLASTDINMGQTNTGGRQVSMEVLPANIASHIDVVKSPTPSTEANFIGGLTNFVTPSAYDFKSGSLTASLRAGLALQKKGDGGSHPVSEAQISGAQRFGDHDQFGIYLSATYWTRYINVPQLEAGGTRNWYTAAGVLTVPYGGNGYAVPSQRLFYNYQNQRERYGLQGRFDWHASQDFSAFIDIYDFHQNERSYRNDLNAAVQSASKDLNQTATSGTLTNVTQTLQLGRYRWHRNLSGLYGRFNQALANNWKLDGGLSWSHATVDNPQTVDNFAQTKLQFNYDTSNETPTFTPVNAATANNFALYSLGYHRQELYSLRENRYDGQLNLAYNSDKKDRGLGLAFGLRSSSVYQADSFTRVSYSGTAYNLSNVLSGNTLCGFGCNTPIPLISPELADAAYAANSSTMTTTVDLASQAGGTFNVHESVNAAYVQGQYRTENWFMIGGVRFEATQDGSSSTQATNGVYTPISASKTYSNVLPSVLAVFDTGMSSKLKISISETVSRPTFGAFALHGGVLNTTSSPPTLTSGNPDLKPRRAENFDLSHDWYIDNGRGILSFAVFSKTIHDDIFNYATTQNIDIGGVSTPTLITQARNVPQAVRTSGVELGFSRDLEFLPAPFDGLGVSANATLSGAHYPVTLSDGSVVTLKNIPEQATRIYNASVYYDKGIWHGRLAWNHLGKLWDDRYPNYTPAGFYANRYQQPTDNFDFKISYDATAHLSLSFDALNLTAQGMKYKYGLDQAYLQSEWKLPAQIMFGIKYRN